MIKTDTNDNSIFNLNHKNYQYTKMDSIKNNNEAHLLADWTNLTDMRDQLTTFFN